MKLWVSNKILHILMTRTEAIERCNDNADYSRCIDVSLLLIVVVIVVVSFESKAFPSIHSCLIISVSA
jgi:hypothetical protein